MVTFMSYMSAKWLKKDHSESAETSEQVLNNYCIPEHPLSTMSIVVHIHQGIKVTTLV